MSTRRRPTSSSTLPKLLIAVLVVAALSIAAYGFAKSQGWLDAKPVAQSKPSREGKVAVPKSLMPLKAFQKVTRDEVFNRELGDDSYFWLPKETVERNPDWVTSVDDIIGRVMAHDKGADYVFKKSDFLPEGSRTGIIGGVPPGKQGFFLEVDKIPGLRFLKQGDHFDLLASLPEESEEATTEYGLLMGGIKVRGNKAIPVNGVHVLVKSGQMIALTTDSLMTTQGGLQLESDNRSRDEKVAIAIDPEEAVPLTQALGEDLKIHMVAKSGQETEQTPIEDQLAGLVPFPANAVALKAFSKIKASDLAEPLSGDLRRYYFKPGDAVDSWIPNVDDLIGRVVARDIEPGYIFSESDFLSDGSLLKEVSAFSAISSDDLVGRDVDGVVGAITARDLQAGEQVSSDDLLGKGSLVRAVEAFQEISDVDLVQGSTEWIGRYAARGMDPGHQMTLQDVLPENSTLKDVEPFQELGSEDLSKGHLSPFVGRVAARGMKAGQELKEEHLFPVGARPGVSAGIPPGKVALSVKSDSVKGLDDLKMGDRIDLIESSVVDLKKSLSGIEFSDSLVTANERAYNEVVASKAVVVHKLENQVVLAVRASEVSGLVKAIAQKNQIVAIARPDQVGESEATELDQGDKDSEIQSDKNPLEKIVVTQMIVGGKKSAKAFRRDNDE